jgi:hypothetical protein
VIGSKKLAEEIRGKIKDYLLNELKLELNIEKTVITNPLDERIKFLGYEISKSKNNAQLFKNSLGRKVRGVNGIINLLVPGEVIREKIKPFKRGVKPIHHNGRVNLPVAEIISEYNAEIRGLYNYYSMATDVGTKLNKYKYYHYFSMVKTIAKKEKISAGKVIAKYGIDVQRKQGTGTRKIVGIRYMTKKSGEKTLTYYNEPLVRINKPNIKIKNYLQSKRSKIVERITSKTCELCGFKSDSIKDFMVHHIRNLKKAREQYKGNNNTTPYWFFVMSNMNRKTLVVCKDCHKEIHGM